MSPNRTRLLQLALATSPLTAASGAHAQDLVLELPGYTGDVSRAPHEGWFTIDTLDMSSVRVARFDGEGNRTLTGAKTGPIEMTTSAEWITKGQKIVGNGLAPAFAELAASGAEVPEATIHFVNGNKNSAQTYYEIELTGVRVASYEMSTPPDASTVERFALTFSTINTRFTPSNDKGPVTPEPWHGWDIENDSPLP